MVTIGDDHRAKGRWDDLSKGFTMMTINNNRIIIVFDRVIPEQSAVKCLFHHTMYAGSDSLTSTENVQCIYIYIYLPIMLDSDR